MDDTGLYYYGARYYDSEIGRFISPDTIVPNPANPQSLNRYSYCMNNPLKYIDPSGHAGIGGGEPGDPPPIYNVLPPWIVISSAIGDWGGPAPIKDTPAPWMIPYTATPNTTTQEEITFNNIILYIRRPNLVSLFGGSKYGYVIANLEMSGKVSVITKDGITTIELHGKTELFYTMLENNVTLMEFTPILVYQTPTGQVRVEMSEVARWSAIHPKDTYTFYWQASLVMPADSINVSILYQWGILMDKRSTEEGAAYMYPDTLSIDLTTKSITTSGTNVHL